MGATNHTPNYNLPQFIGTDKPTWLSDVNGAFSDIDTQMKANATSAAQGISDAGAAATTATAANNKANTLDTQINTPSTGLAAVVSGHTSDISSINSKIGVTALPTVDQTLTGAIAEVDGKIDKGYVQVTPNESETFQSVFNRLFALIDFTKVNKDSALVVNDNGHLDYYHINDYATGVIRFTKTSVTDSSCNSFMAVLDSSLANCDLKRVTFTAGSTAFSQMGSSVANDTDYSIYY